MPTPPTASVQPGCVGPRSWAQPLRQPPCGNAGELGDPKLGGPPSGAGAGAVWLGPSDRDSGTVTLPGKRRRAISWVPTMCDSLRHTVSRNAQQPPEVNGMTLIGHRLSKAQRGGALCPKSRTKLRLEPGPALPPSRPPHPRAPSPRGPAPATRNCVTCGLRSFNCILFRKGSSENRRKG